MAEFTKEMVEFVLELRIKQKTPIQDIYGNIKDKWNLSAAETYDLIWAAAHLWFDLEQKRIIRETKIKKVLGEKTEIKDFQPFWSANDKIKLNTKKFYVPR